MYWSSANNLRQEVTASILRIAHPHLSDVVNHKTAEFTIDALVAMLAWIGKPARVKAR